MTVGGVSLYPFGLLVVGLVVLPADPLLIRLVFVLLVMLKMYRADTMKTYFCQYHSCVVLLFFI